MICLFAWLCYFEPGSHSLVSYRVLSLTNNGKLHSHLLNISIHSPCTIMGGSETVYVVTERMLGLGMPLLPGAPLGVGMPACRVSGFEIDQ